jgi:ABC-type antimicrobial peptide transport system permease subunit
MPNRFLGEYPRDIVHKEDKMFKNRSFSTLVGLTIAVLAVLSIGTLAFTQRTPSVVESSRSNSLDWYLSNDHAILDGNNNVVSGVNIPVNSSPLDWYFSHDHAILDGDNNVIPAANAAPSQGLRDNRLAPLDWYFSHDHAILAGDNNVVPVAANVAPSEGIRDNRLAPLDWYFSHDHAILDGDNNVVPVAN